MKSAAKRRNFFSAFIALALLFCASHVASANVLEISKTRAELKSNLAENHVEPLPFYSVKLDVNYDSLQAIASESSVAPRTGAEGLPQLKGKSEAHIRKTLEDAGFERTKVSNSAARNETWKHPDGSEVRVHPYGNQNQAPYKSANNAHVHKQGPNGNQLNDRGLPSTDPNATHIGIRNPKDLPTVRNRPHGAGSQ